MGKPRGWVCVLSSGIMEEKVSQLGLLSPSCPTPHYLCRASSLLFLGRPWGRRQALGDWQLPAIVRRDYLTAWAEGAMAGSLLIIAIEALVSAGLGVPGSRGFINPTAVLGGVHCCCYLYLSLCSSGKESQLGLCSRDTEHVELELQLPAYATATATLGPSHIFNLHHSLQLCQILHPGSEVCERGQGANPRAHGY